MRDALWQDLCCSALLLVIVLLREQHTFTEELAVRLACCLLSALFCTAALISEGCTLAGSVLQCTVAGRCAFVRAAYFHGYTCSDASLLSALFCTAALISEGCTLAGSMLQCSVAGHCGISNFSNLTLQ